MSSQVNKVIQELGDLSRRLGVLERELSSAGKIFLSRIERDKYEIASLLGRLKEICSEASSRSAFTVEFYDVVSKLVAIYRDIVSGFYEVYNVLNLIYQCVVAVRDLVFRIRDLLSSREFELFCREYFEECSSVVDCVRNVASLLLSTIDRIDGVVRELSRGAEHLREIEGRISGFRVRVTVPSRFVLL